ncbi:hypothetical protein [Duncaniella dubosii]|uniref:hypothetical protein n=1 Tax=Duncaniella dubosii TaxID=2518971 RepID=UPI003F66219A
MNGARLGIRRTERRCKRTAYRKPRLCKFAAVRKAIIDSGPVYEIALRDESKA